MEQYSDFYGKETILLVEDNPQVLEFAFKTIKHYNYNVISASDGAEALKRIKEIKNSVDLLITDLVMPNINGKDLADKLVTINPKIKVLFISGYTNNQISKDGEIEAGVNLLNKPFSIVSLMKKIREILDKWRFYTAFTKNRLRSFD